MGPSWVDFPFTVKVTPLGALDLTSMLAKLQQKMVSSTETSIQKITAVCQLTYQGWCGRSPCSGAKLQNKFHHQHGATEVEFFGVFTSLAALAMSEKAAGAAIVRFWWKNEGI